ncbi:MAG TPA: flagellar type III secretion system pore protein FliP [Syntrophales bacterium]|nr:flagellar type III secretion system pore protein FliP [Syntrophales bacterium]HOU77081.1 flagellar type III secretion system pore protein FliP [Syntrophales bacterium]HPC33119.1 flagellar type III secretion system pore protein FliP [Syntrophales bacterium]HQG35335.1 flagellar type III secretion system pore protein FliP [Syntrophales bacterium]HQI35579.1 flagellar type III secretion system pore protein FliP [Syntrophales bacterium]
MKKIPRKYPLAVALLVGGLLCAAAGIAVAEPLALPNISLNIGGGAPDSPTKAATVIQLLFILTVLSLAPAILLMVTSFTRVVVVLSLLRHALGTQQIPPNQIVIGMALFLTFFIMTPVWQKVNQEALQPYYNEEISGEEAMTKAVSPVKDFMLKQTREKDLALFVKIGREKQPAKPEDISLSVLIPAFMISELKTAFQIGFMIYLPFFIIDMVISSILLSMGMMMLPPIMLSLPFKLLLFVLVDGWYLIVGSLVKSFH